MVKLGTGVLTDSRKQPDLTQMEQLVTQVAEQCKGGKEIDPCRPRHRHCLSAKTTRAPVFFDMLLKGSP